jgi:hypothetical protein
VRSLRRGRDVICPPIEVDQGGYSWESRFGRVILQWSVGRSIIRVRYAQGTQRQVSHCERVFVRRVAWRQ